MNSWLILRTAVFFPHQKFLTPTKANVLSRAPLLLAVAWFTTCLATITTGLAVRLAPVELTLAWPSFGPWPAAATITSPVALVLAALSGIMLFLLTGAAREGRRARPFGELLVFFPVVFAFVWLLVPTEKPSVIAIVFGLSLLAASLFLFRHSPGPLPSKPWQRKFSTISLDAGLVLFPVLLALTLRYSPDLRASGLSLFLYPLYAFIQLAVFLYIPVTRLRAMGVSSENSTLFAALIFSLIHWPNPLVMLATLVGMLIWAHQFQKGRPLWQLALVMGLTATTFSQFLPDDLTHHMRVGPGFVRSEAVSLLAADPGFESASDFLEFAYPQTVGRAVLPEEIETFSNLVDEARRCTWAYMFLSSQEHRQLLAEAHEIQPPAPVIHWSDWPPDMKSRIATFASEEFFQNAGNTPEGYLKALYLEILNRQTGDAEIQAWLKNISIEQRQRIAQVLLQHRARHGQEVFKGMDIEEFRYPN